MDLRLQPSWLLVGPTGAGKTPLGRLMAEKGLAGRRCAHFDFGAELRAVGAAGVGAGLGAAEVAVVRRSLETGALLEDSEFPIALKVLHAFVLRTGLAEGDRLALNGLPRHVGQARMMEDVMRVETVVSLEATAEVLRERIALDTGGDRAGRADDDLHALRRKLVIFRMRTLPLIGYYDNREVPVLRLTVGARTTAGEMYDAVLGLSGRGKSL